MAVTHNGDQGILEFHDVAELVPRTDNALEKLGLFESFFGVSTDVAIERIEDGYDAMKASERGGERNYAGQEKAQREYFRIPFFTLDKMTQPHELQDFREYATADAPATVEKRVERNVARIMKSHDFLKRTAMYTALKGSTFARGLEGTQYIKSFADVWGVAADVKTVALDFTANTNPALWVETNVRQHITAQAKDNASSYKVVALCGSGFFNSLTNHPTVQGAFDAYPSAQEPLRNRLGGDTVGQIFEYKGVTYIEDISGEIARGDAYFLPLGIQDMFQLHYAPADTMADVNSVAREAYIWLEETRRTAKVESETSFVAVNTRPELVVTATGNTLLADA